MNISKINSAAFDIKLQSGRVPYGLMANTAAGPKTLGGDEFGLAYGSDGLRAFAEVETPTIYVVLNHGDAIEVDGVVYRMTYEAGSLPLFTPVNPANYPPPPPPQLPVTTRFLRAIRARREAVPGETLKEAVAAVRAANPEFADVMPNVH